MDRTSKSIKNLSFALVAQAVTAILSFAVQTAMIRSLGMVSVSLNRLFTDVIAALSLAEMGVGSAIVFNLYKPLAEHDEKKICQLMYLFKKAYFIIAMATLGIGLALVPWIHLLIEKIDIPIGYLRLVYVLFVMQSAFSYLFSYKTALLTADQKAYVYTRITMICRIVGSIILIAIIYLTKAYIPYLIGSVLMVLITNAIASRAVDKIYPFLVNDPTLPEEEKKQIFSNVRNIFLKQFAGRVVDSTDNILISKLVGTLTVGYCSNYSLIIGVFKQLSGKVSDAMSASFGNLFVTEENDKVIEVIRRLTFIFFLFALISSAGIYACIQPFITIWLDDSFLLPKFMVFLYCLLFFTSTVYTPLTFAMHLTGYFDIGRNISTVSAIVNLIVSIILGKMIGLPGIFIGTACTYVIEIVAKIHYLFRVYFKTSPLSYAWFWGKMLFSFCAVVAVIETIDRTLHYTPIVSFFMTGVISVVLSALIVFVLFGRTIEMRYTKELVKAYAEKIRNRR